MLDNILFYDQEGLVLDIYVVNSGSSEAIVYDTLMQSVEGTVGGSVDYVLYENIMQPIPAGSTGTYFPITLTVPMSIKYLNKTLYYQ